MDTKYYSLEFPVQETLSMSSEATTQGLYLGVIPVDRNTFAQNPTFFPAPQGLNMETANPEALTATSLSVKDLNSYVSIIPGATQPPQNAVTAMKSISVSDLPSEPPLAQHDANVGGDDFGLVETAQYSNVSQADYPVPFPQSQHNNVAQALYDERIVARSVEECENTHQCGNLPQ